MVNPFVTRSFKNASFNCSELVNQQCKISAEAVAMLKGLRYGNTSIRKDVSTLINASPRLQKIGSSLKRA